MISIGATLNYCITCHSACKSKLILRQLLPPDIDECTLGTANCTQNCLDLPGSYSCSCDPGYTLAPDGITCVGESLGLTGSSAVQALLLAMFDW